MKERGASPADVLFSFTMLSIAMSTSVGVQTSWAVDSDARGEIKKEIEMKIRKRDMSKSGIRRKREANTRLRGEPFPGKPHRRMGFTATFEKRMFQYINIITNITKYLYRKI